MKKISDGGYRLLSNGCGSSAYNYSKKLIDGLVTTDLQPDFVLSQFKNITEKIQAEPTRVRELNDIVSRLIYIISHLQYTQAILNQEMLNFLKNHQHKMRMTTE